MSGGVGLSTGQLHRGRKIGRYEVLTQLSKGGMAELFLAFTSGPGGFRKHVVVKRILPDVREDEPFVKMFLDEARVTAALNHPNIAQVYDLGEDDEGPYLVMEFVAGQNLNQVCLACRRQRRPLPLGFSAAVVRDVCLALHSVHTFRDTAGDLVPVIHRDVAEKNVMVTYEGTTKLLDFGLAKVKSPLTQSEAGQVKGTTGYMSPEQARGEELDARSDVFCAGVVLYELLTGQRLFGAETEREELDKVLFAPVPRPNSINPDIPEGLCEVVVRALARERGDRFSSAREMARALEVSCERILYHPEQVAELMTELFSEKQDATRALLESAGAAEETVLAHAAAEALTADDGVGFSEQARSSTRRPADSRGTAPAGLSQTLVEAAGLFSPTLPETPASAPVRTDKSLWGPVVAAGVGVVLLGGLFLWASSGPEESLPVGPSPLKPLPGAVLLGAPPTLHDFEDTRGAPVPARGLAASTTGTFSLSSSEPCAVKLGEQVLGVTPLSGERLPAGSHTLELVCNSGPSRSVLVTIRAGKNTPLKVEWDTVPP